MVMFSMGLKAWAFIILWFLLAPIAQKLDLGPIYVSALRHLPMYGSTCHTFTSLLDAG